MRPCGTFASPSDARGSLRAARGSEDGTSTPARAPCASPSPPPCSPQAPPSPLALQDRAPGHPPPRAVAAPQWRMGPGRHRIQSQGLNPLTAGCCPRWGPEGAAHPRGDPAASPSLRAHRRSSKGPARTSTKGSAVSGAAQRSLRFQMNIDSANYRPPCRQLISLSQKDGIELKARGIHRAQQDAPQTAQRTRQANNLQQN